MASPRENGWVRTLDKVSALVFLDLSAAFDTINHKILLSRLCPFYGLVREKSIFVSSSLTRHMDIILHRHSSVGRAKDAVELLAAEAAGKALLLFSIVQAGRILPEQAVLPGEVGSIFSKHISGLPTAFWPRDALLDETACSDIFVNGN